MDRLLLFFAGATIEVSLGIAYLIAERITVASYVTNLIELIGLGLGVDYSLLIVFRFREELRRTRAMSAAVIEYFSAAGRTVLVAGTSVALGLALLLVIPIPFVRSLGLGGLLIPLSSMAATLTLLPALLATYGRRGAETTPPVPRLPQPSPDRSCSRDRRSPWRSASALGPGGRRARRSTMASALPPDVASVLFPIC